MNQSVTSLPNDTIEQHMVEHPSNPSTPSEVVIFSLDFDIENESLENGDAQAREDPHGGIRKESSQSSSSRQYPQEQVFKPKQSLYQPDSS
eukprot:5964976-Karenia_brevis.AAC.1